MKKEEIGQAIVELLEKTNNIEKLGWLSSFLAAEDRKRNRKIVVRLQNKASASLEEKISAFLRGKFGNDLTVEYHDEPDLVGGLVVEVDGKVYDLSTVIGDSRS